MKILLQNRRWKIEEGSLLARFNTFLVEKLTVRNSAKVNEPQWRDLLLKKSLVCLSTPFNLQLVDLPKESICLPHICWSWRAEINSEGVSTVDNNKGVASKFPRLPSAFGWLWKSQPDECIHSKDRENNLQCRQLWFVPISACYCCYRRTLSSGCRHCRHRLLGGIWSGIGHLQCDYCRLLRHHYIGRNLS